MMITVFGYVAELANQRVAIRVGRCVVVVAFHTLSQPSIGTCRQLSNGQVGPLFL